VIIDAADFTGTAVAIPSVMITGAVVLCDEREHFLPGKLIFFLIFNGFFRRLCIFFSHDHRLSIRSSSSSSTILFRNAEWWRDPSSCSVVARAGGVIIRSAGFLLCTGPLAITGGSSRIVSFGISPRMVIFGPGVIALPVSGGLAAVSAAFGEALKALLHQSAELPCQMRCHNKIHLNPHQTQGLQGYAMHNIKPRNMDFKLVP
jgi:hypothetical protein